MWVRSIVKGSIPRTGDDIRLSGRALDRDRRVALKRLPELALQYPAGGFPGLRLEPHFHPEAIPAVRYAASPCRSSPGQAPSGLTGKEARPDSEPEKAASPDLILLDTDHLPVYTDERDPRHELLNSRMEAAAEQVACTIVNVEEVLRGWLALIHRLRDVHRQPPAYVRLGQLFNVLTDWEIVPFDGRAADQFSNLRRQGIRIGTMDLKIASIALVNDALLVTGNLHDYSLVPYSLVPELRCENWLPR
jgi:tRNA(fMet)-specific endonuclease VapC